MHDEVEYSLVANGRKVTVILSQMIVYLSA